MLPGMGWVRSFVNPAATQCRQVVRPLLGICKLAENGAGRDYGGGFRYAEMLYVGMGCYSYLSIR